ncbi:MAG: hypothetical protein JW741_29755 [Sedimentisphaerales bacterium]|nr:hypothetical protein [Sedimentisphaerales bacterium]
MWSLFVEIVLVWTAWKRGWGWLALAPVTICWVASFSIGFWLGVRGASVAEHSYVPLATHTACFLSLVIMNIIRPEKPKNEGATPC